jgi:hypothetical protein
MKFNSKLDEPRRIVTNSSKTSMLTQDNIGRGFLFLNATNREDNYPPVEAQ